MAVDNQAQGSFLSGLTTKQKVMAAATVVIFLFVIWLAMGMFGGDKITPTPPTQMASSTSRQMSSGAPGGSPAQQNASAAMAAQQQQATPQIVQTNVMTPNKDADAMKQQQVVQKEYLDKLNELQMLKVQREITETNQAIAAAKLATVTADKSMTDLLTKPVAPEVPVGAYATRLAGPTQVGAPSGSQPPPLPTEPVVETPYVVISVSMQFNKWSAVIGAQGKLYSVSAGDVLPLDGSVVFSINKQGVVLEKDGKKRTISIVSSI